MRDATQTQTDADADEPVTAIALPILQSQAKNLSNSNTIIHTSVSKSEVFC